MTKEARLKAILEDIEGVGYVKYDNLVADNFHGTKIIKELIEKELEENND